MDADRSNKPLPHDIYGSTYVRGKEFASGVTPTHVRRAKHSEKREQANLKKPDQARSDAALWEYCDKHYHQLLPIIAEKVHQEKVQQEKLKEMKARLNFEGCSRRNSKIREVSQHSESRTPNVRGEHRRGRKSRRSRSMSRSPERTSVFPRIRRDRDRGVFNRLGVKGVSAHSESRYQISRSERTESVPRKRHHEGTCSRRTEMLSESEDSGGGQRRSKSKKQKSSIEEEDLSQPWVCEETDPFTPRIRYFELPKNTRMPSNVKTYDGSDDPEDHLKKFQAAAKVEHWAMLTWCHKFNSILTGSARNPVEIHHIKQREGESTKDFVQRFKTKSRHVKRALECMRIYGFMHEITNPELIKRLRDNIPKSVDEIMRVTTTFLKGEVAASNQARKSTLLAWKQQEAGRKQDFDKRGDFRNKLGVKGVSAHSESRYQISRSERTESVPRKRHHEGTCSRRTEMLSESEDSGGGQRRSKSKKQKSSIEEEDLSQPWVCEETDPFTPRIRYFELPKNTRMPSNVKTYDGSDDPEDHLKKFQAAAKVEHWAMLTWCHKFNSILTGSARNPVEIHHIKQREGESTKDFVQRFKTKSRHVKRALECMRIYGFMHEITNPELIKRLRDNIPKSVDEIMRVTTTFLKGEVAASNQARKSTLLAWKQQEAGRKQDFDKRGDFRNKQIEELIKAGKLSHVINELKQGSGKDQPKAAKKGEASKKRQSYGNFNVPTMAESGQPKDYTKLLPNPDISFPPLGDEDGMEDPMIIEAEIGGHFIHC
nr:hypothetical protein [Tanacetum cinerariifolium]